MMWIWATLVLIHSNPTWSKMWALGFATIDKVFCENANQFIYRFFLLGTFHQSPTWEEYDFFPYKVVISLFPKNSGQILTKHLRKFCEMCYSRINWTNFSILGRGEINRFSYGKNWKSNPGTKDIHGKTNSNSPNSKNSKSQFLNDKFQGVTK